MGRLFPILLCVLLVGCSDPKVDAAQCRIDHKDNVNDCMIAKGYEKRYLMSLCYSGSFLEGQEECYEKRNLVTDTLRKLREWFR